MSDKKTHVKYTGENGQVQEADVSPGQDHEVLLDRLEEAGITLPFGCRSGSCGVCRVQFLNNVDLCEAKGPSEEDTLERCGDDESVRLACRCQLSEWPDSLELKFPPPPKEFEG